MKVGVIGAGATGMTAALALLKQGHSVEVFEAASFLGGQASTFEIGGGRLEKGYHHLFMSDTHMVDLIHELGLGNKLKWIESRVGLFHSEKIWKFSTPKDLLTFSPLSTKDRLRLGLVTLYLQRTKKGLKFEGVTAAEWLRKRIGQKAYEVVWEPLLRGKFGEHYAEIGMTWLWGKIYLRVASRGKPWEREKLGYPMGSFGEVFDTLGQRLEELGGQVHTSAMVRRVVVEDGRATGLEVQMGDSGEEIRSYDAVIATTPSYVFNRLVPPLPECYAKNLTNVTYLSAVLLILEMSRPLSPIYWMNIADRQMPFVGVIEHTNLVDPSLYGGKRLIYLTNYPSQDNPIYKMTGEELFQHYLPHLKKINPALDPSWIEGYHHHKVDAAQPIIGIDYSQRIPDLRTPIPGLYLANTTQIYPEDRGTNYSVRLGKEVAQAAVVDAGEGL